MSKPWTTVLVAWLAASALAVAQAPPASSNLPGAQAPPAPPLGPPGPTTAPAPPGKPADPPPTQPAGPGLPPGFVPAVPYCAAPPPEPLTPSPILSGILAPPWVPPVAWVRADALLWWIREQPDPQALLRISSLTSAPGFIGQPTALNDPIAQTVLGQNSISMGSFGGGRLTAGFWFDYERSFGVEANGFFLSQNSTSQQAGSDPNTGMPILGRPFYDVNLGMESASPVSSLGSQAGNMIVTVNSQMQGGEANLLKVISSSTEDVRLIFMCGGRFLNLTEQMQITSNTNLVPNSAEGVTFLGQPLTPPQGLSMVDTFKTQNQFVGGQVGFRVEWWGEYWYLRAQGEVALGSLIQSININGSTSLLSSPGGTVLNQAPGGFLAQPSNIGTFDRTVTSVMPSLECQLGYQLCPHFWLDLGYSFLAMTKTVRPGLEIDHDLNLTQAPYVLPVPLAGAPAVTNVNRPTALFNDQTFWAHGLSLGLRLTY